MDYHFRKAEVKDSETIWAILQTAIQRRKEDGSNQWQDGYPNPTIIAHDIEHDHGFVLTENGTVIGYCAVLINDEPDYELIEGEWLTNGDFVVFHRMAIAETHGGKGLAGRMMHHIENFALENKIQSVKADTNHDNPAMKRTFEKAGYSFCGQVYIKGSPRKAFEKALSQE